MRLPRPRLTIRRLMLAVALLAVGLGVAVEAARASRRAAACKAMVARAGQAKARAGDAEKTCLFYIRSREGELASCRKTRVVDPGLVAFLERDIESSRAQVASLRRTAAYWSSLLEKYSRASERPWRPIEPDPPEPE